MLFDWLVTGQVVPWNPAGSVKGPRHSVKKGRTPVLEGEQARALLNSIDPGTIIGLRDRAMIAMMVFSFARISAVVGMNVEDYHQDGNAGSSASTKRAARSTPFRPTTRRKNISTPI